MEYKKTLTLAHSCIDYNHKTQPHNIKGKKKDKENPEKEKPDMLKLRNQN